MNQIRYKSDKDSITEILRKKGITCLYHFTAMENIDSIRRCGGLYSLGCLAEKIEKEQMPIPVTGGDGFSIKRDFNNGLANYVHLSFCQNHPMLKKSKDNGVLLVILEIDIEVATWEGTFYSNMNASDNGCSFGSSAHDLKNLVDFDAVKQKPKGYNINDKHYQAEVLVKDFIPKEYIINLNSPLSLVNDYNMFLKQNGDIYLKQYGLIIKSNGSIYDLRTRRTYRL